MLCCVGVQGGLDYTLKFTTIVCLDNHWGPEVWEQY